PAFQELQRIDSHGTPSAEELARYAEGLAPGLAKGLLLTQDSTPLVLNTGSARASLVPGAGGLPTLRIECEFQVVLEHAAGVTGSRVRFEDNNFQGRLG